MLRWVLVCQDALELLKAQLVTIFKFAVVLHLLLDSVVRQVDFWICNRILIEREH